MNESLGSKIRRIRREKGITLRAFAKTAGISPSLLSIIEQGQHKPNSTLISRLSRELGLDADQMCGLAGKVTPEAEAHLAKLAKEKPDFFRQLCELMKNENTS